MNLTVASYDDAVKDDFVIPTSYVRFQTVPQATDDDRVDIDLEFAELKWLKQHPKYGDNGDPRYQISPATFAKMLDVLEKASALINPNVITPAEAEEVFARTLEMVKTPLNRVTVDVYNYWVQKRAALKRPLLRKYWPQTPLNDTNPHLVFRPREKERYKLRKHRKNDMDGYRKLQQLRADCDRVRQLLDLVKRREKAKRLGIDFLDEIRRQAVHELTSRDVRVPELPVDYDDRSKSRKAKKKKKTKHARRDGDGDDSSADAAANGSRDALDHGAGSVSANGVESSKSAVAGASSVGGSAPASSVRVATFLDRSAGLDDDDDAHDLKSPYYPSYPLPSSHLMASLFAQPPKFRCRGRIGRGGRLVIDRIPVPPSRYYGPTEVSATTGTFSAASGTAVAGTAAAGAAPGGLSDASAPPAHNHYHHHHPTAILIHETAFRPVANKLAGVTTKRLDEIYSMSDSEDELFEPLSSSVYETPSARKQTSAGTGSSKAPAARATKFALDI